MEDEIKSGGRERLDKKEPKTWSGFSIKRIYTPEDVTGISYSRDIADAGDYPYTRGIYRDMYRGERFWSMRKITGFGRAIDTNKRLKYYAQHGLSGFNCITDLPSIMWMDPDHPRAEGEVGVQGTSICCVRDMENLTEGIPLDKTSWNLHFTPAQMAAYCVCAMKGGYSLASLTGTELNDVIMLMGLRYAPIDALSICDLMVKLGIDVIEYCTKQLPNVRSFYNDSYNFRELFSSAPLELAWLFSKAKYYIVKLLERGFKVDDFRRGITFYLSSHQDFFEEIAKMRAARRIWARIMKEEFKAQDSRTMKFKFGVHNSGETLVSRNILNNITRITLQALAAILGGVQSMDLCSYDEPVALPTEESGILSLQTQQILAYETGVANVVDPLGGSYYIENLTNRIEEETYVLLKEIEDEGGVIQAIKKGWFDKKVSDNMVNYQRGIESGEITKVGVNKFCTSEEEERFVNYHRVEPEWAQAQIASIKELKEGRNKGKLREALERLGKEAQKGERVNLFPLMMKAMEEQATIQEVSGVIRQAWGFKYDPFDMVESPL